MPMRRVREDVVLLVVLTVEEKGGGGACAGGWRRSGGGVDVRRGVVDAEAGMIAQRWLVGLLQNESQIKSVPIQDMGSDAVFVKRGLSELGR